MFNPFPRIAKVTTCAALVALMAAPTFGVIINPTLNSTLNENALSNGLNLIDNSGLSAAVNSGSTLAAAQAVTHSRNGGYTESYVSNGSGSDYSANFGLNSPPTFVWDLGSSQSIDNILLWQYQNNGGNNTNVGNQAYTADLRFSNSTVFGGEATSITIDTVIGAGASHPAQTINLTGALGANNARFVELVLTDNAVGIPGITGGGDRIGLGEVRFDTSASAAALTRNLITPVGVALTAGTTYSSYVPGHLIDSSGLNGVADINTYASVQHTTQNGSSLWVTNNPAGGANYYTSQAPDPQLVFNLDSIQDLTDMVVWGYANGNSNGGSDFTVEFSQDGGATYYASTEVASGDHLGQDNATLTFDDIYAANTVRVTITNNVDRRTLTTAPGGDRVGLGEVRFIGVQQTQVPEPASASLLLLGGAALLRRRRRAA